MEESNKRLKSSNEACETDINQLLTLFDYETIDRIMSSSGDSQTENYQHINKYVEEEDDDISELTVAKDHGFDVFKNILMRNNENNNSQNNNDQQTAETSEESKIQDTARQFNIDSSASSSSSSIIPNKQPNEKSLFLIPYLLRDFINAGDLSSIICLIKENFTENCLFKTPALTKRKEGRHFIIEYFQSVLRCIPDVIITCNTPTVKISTLAGKKFKIITSDMTSTGTMISRDSSDYLWNDVSNRKENKAYLHQLQERMTSFFKSCVRFGINSTGFALHIHNEIILQMTLNDNKTMIESFVVTRRSIKLKMVRP